MIQAEQLRRALPGETLPLIQPTFPLNIQELVRDQHLKATFMPPVSHATPPILPFKLIVKSDSYGVAIKPFQLRDNYPEATAHPTGGLVIYTGNEARLVILAGEYPLRYSPTNEFIRVAPTLDLLKVDPYDQQVLVKPILADRRGIAYVLQNDYRDRRGLMLPNDQLEITDTGGTILVDRDPS